MSRIENKDVNNYFSNEVDSFCHNFEKMKNLKKVLYGTGRKTAVLSDIFEKINIIGLCDKGEELIGTSKYGLRILSQEEAEKNADILIINTTSGYWITIYNRIKNWNIPIYFADGSMASTYDEVDKNDSYWKCSIDELKMLINNYDNISFDIFDTLITRKIYQPNDIFELLEKVTKVEGLAATRRKIEGELLHPTLDEIYNELYNIGFFDKETSLKIKEIELDIDKRLIVPRKDMVALAKEISDSHKVFYITDMYYSKDEIIELLSLIGIKVDENRVLISSELKRDKKNGELWEYYRSIIPNEAKALHVGNDLIGDVVRPQEYGIDTFYIRDGRELLERCSLKNCHLTNDSIEYSVALGGLVADILNSPFRCNGRYGYFSFIDSKEMGKAILGGAMYTFCKWLYNRCQRNGDNKLVFLGRDGYFIKKEFDSYLYKFVTNNNLETIYLDISRAFIWRVLISSEEDIYSAIEKIPFTGTIYELFLNRFNVEIDEKYKNIEYTNDLALVKDIISEYSKVIIESSILEKKEYLNYLREKGISGAFSIVDLSYFGSIQHGLGKILDIKLRGYYVTANLLDSNWYAKSQKMEGCYGNYVNENESFFLKRAIFMESFFTSPTGSMKGIHKNSLQFANPCKNQIHFGIREVMNRGICEYFEDLHLLEESFQIDIAKPRIWNEIFEMFMDGGFIPSEEMKDSFYRDDYASTTDEYRIWE